MSVAEVFSVSGRLGHQPPAGRQLSQRRQRRRRVEHRRQRRRVVLDGAMESGSGVENLLAGNVFGGGERRRPVQEPISFYCVCKDSIFFFRRKFSVCPSLSLSLSLVFAQDFLLDTVYL